MDLSKPGSARFLVQHHATAKFGEFVVQARPTPMPIELFAEAFEVHDVPGFGRPPNAVHSAVSVAHDVIVKASHFVMQVCSA